MSCISGSRLKTMGVSGEEVSGTYDLILYGGRHSNDLETVAFLDNSGDGYTFEPYVREDSYKVQKGLPAREALKKAEHFISGHPEYRSSQLRKILDTAGTVIGYEVHPLYMPLAYGTDDVFDVSYVLKEGKVIIYVRLYPWVERILYDGGPGDGARD